MLSFVAAPERTIRHIAGALKPGGVAVFHEYADYGAWPMMPPETGARRLAALGYVAADEAERLATVLHRAGPGARMITPIVAELIARKR